LAEISHYNKYIAILTLQALQYLTVFLMATNKFCNFSTTIPWYTALLQ